MIFRNLDDNHDWTFGSGKQDYLTEDAAIFKNIETRILSFFKDCFFAMQDGIDWFTRLNGSDQFDLLKYDLRNLILKSVDVVSLEDFDASLENRTITTNFTIKTIYSPSVQGVVTQSI